MDNMMVNYKNTSWSTIYSNSRLWEAGLLILFSVVSPSLSAQEPEEILTLPMEVVERENPESVVYCTIADDSGLYDIHLTDRAGNIMTTFDRICIQYQEIVRETSGGNPDRNIDSRMNVRQKETIRKANSIGPDVEFDTEFFHKIDPSQRLVYFPAGTLNRNCTKNHTYPVNSTASFGKGPEILPQAASQGLLHISYYPGKACP